MFSPGDLVIYRHDPRSAVASNLYCVLAEALAERPRDGRNWIVIEALVRERIWKPSVTTYEPMVVLAEDCFPLADFGRRVKRIERASERRNFDLITLEPTGLATRKWGRGSAIYPYLDDRTSIASDRIAALIEARYADLREAA